MSRNATVLLVPTLALMGGCSLFGGDSGIDDEERARLADLYNETARIEQDLAAAQHRLALACMEERGHTAHDLHFSTIWPPMEREDGVVARPVDGFLLDPDEAAEWGFGNWVYSWEMTDSEEAEEYRNLTAEKWGDFFTVDNSDFEALSDADKYQWYVDYFGEESAAADFAYLDGAARDFESFSVLGQVEPGGCLRDMIEQFGLEPVWIDTSELGDDYGSWATYDPSPLKEELVKAEVLPGYRAAIADYEESFLDCIAGLGYGEWSFNRNGTLNVWHFLSTLQYEADGPESTTEGVPDPPADAPTDAAGRKEYEIAMALDFIDCGDSSGLAENARAAWDDAVYAYYLEVEAATYAWQEDMRAAIERAQALLES